MLMCFLASPMYINILLDISLANPDETTDMVKKLPDIMVDEDMYF